MNPCEFCEYQIITECVKVQRGRLFATDEFIAEEEPKYYHRECFDLQLVPTVTIVGEDKWDCGENI